jgi:short-subunit dehydrogenase
MLWQGDGETKSDEGSNRMSDRSARKVVLVTGASAGIGAAVACEAARQGHDVALTARRADRLAAAAEECAATGVDIHVIPANLENPEACERIVAETVGHFGGIDVLVNNAGVGLPTLFAGSDPKALRRQLEVNFVAPLVLTRLALPHLAERRGTIINIGSSITSMPNPALGAYGATKAGLAYWTKALRRELRPKGMNVCLVEPGPVKTEFFDALTATNDHQGYHPLLDAPYDWMTCRVEDAARQIVRLIRRPVRRLAFPRRTVWPWRAFGGLCEAVPALGDAAIGTVIRHFERQAARRRAVPVLPEVAESE